MICALNSGAPAYFRGAHPSVLVTRESWKRVSAPEHSLVRAFSRGAREGPTTCRCAREFPARIPLSENLETIKVGQKSESAREMINVLL